MNITDIFTAQSRRYLVNIINLIRFTFEVGICMKISNKMSDYTNN